MQQSEHRKRIIEINSMSISTIEKSRMIQNLMCPKKTEEINFNKKNKIMLQCSHYNRYTHQVSKCCKKVYPCRICHDEKEDHKINRHDIDYMKCIYCNCFQKVDSSCKNPECFKFNVSHKHFCKKCNLWSDNYDLLLKNLNSYLITDINISKPTFHCDKCGICRLGRKEEHKHCDNCNMCLNIKLYNSHICKSNVKGQDCPICLRSLWNTPNETSQILKCGHYVHSGCFNQNLRSNNFYCPICKKSAVDLSDYWKLIDQVLETQQMPEEFQSWTADIYCNDCEKKTNTKYHFSYHKCQECGGYNTVIDNINK